MKLSGGDKLAGVLRALSEKVGKRATLQVGFPEGDNYPDGTPVALVAAVNEFGGTVNVPEHEATIYRSLDEDGDLTKDGQFVKKTQSNFATTHIVPAHTITTPPRPFFRTTIANKSKEWGDKLGRLLQHNGNDGKLALAALGQTMADDVTESIRTWSDPPNAPSTIRKKGFNKPLVDTGWMMKSVKFMLKE